MIWRGWYSPPKTSVRIASSTKLVAPEKSCIVVRHCAGGPGGGGQPWAGAILGTPTRTIKVRSFPRRGGRAPAPQAQALPAGSKARLTRKPHANARWRRRELSSRQASAQPRRPARVTLSKVAAAVHPPRQSPWSLPSGKNARGRVVQLSRDLLDTPGLLGGIGAAGGTSCGLTVILSNWQAKAMMNPMTWNATVTSAVIAK